MVLEAIMLVLDNSEYARNGDLQSNSRWQSQTLALELISEACLNGNAESGIGLILGGGKQVQLLMTPTNVADHLLSQTNNIRLIGQFHFLIAIQQAQLALKHRLNKKQKQRIVVFVASPIEDDEAELESLAKRLRRNEIAVDVINFGEQNEKHLKKLEVFCRNVQKNKNSFFLNLEPGQGIYEYFQHFSRYGKGDGQMEVQPQGGLPYAEYGGVDPNLDPELAEALKLSMQDQHQMPQTQQIQQDEQAQQQNTQQSHQQQGLEEEDDDNEEEALLAKAKLLSQQNNPGGDVQVQPPQQQQGQQQPPQQPPQQQNQMPDENQVDEDFLNDLGVEDEEVQKLLKKNQNQNDQND